MTSFFTAQLDSLHAEIETLESRASQLIRKNKALEMEIDTLRAQVAARDIALEEAYAEVKAAQTQRSQSEEVAILRERIESLSNEVSMLCVVFLVDVYIHATLRFRFGN